MRLYIKIDRKKLKKIRERIWKLVFFLLRYSVILKKGIIFISMFLFYYYCYKVRNLNDIEKGMKIEMIF